MSASHGETAGDWGYPEPGGEVFTEGHAGSDTSRDRALTDARLGRDVKRRHKTMELLREAGERGLTWWELDNITDWGHGKVSGALSNLHKEGSVARLAETRGRSKVYVLWHLAGDRDTEVRKSNPPPCTAEDIAAWEAKGNTEGYQRGFDDGQSIVSEEAVREAHIEGRREGERVAQQRLAQHILNLSRAVKGANPGMHVHSGACYLTRTPCLIDAVMRGVTPVPGPVKGRSA